jgi:hypothetical protein
LGWAAIEPLHDALDRRKAGDQRSVSFGGGEANRVSLQVDLPLNGYYCGGPTYCDMWVFLKFYADGFWFFQDVDEDQVSGFDFPAYLSSLDVESIKQQFPLGHSRRGNPRGFLYRCGRYTRQADVPVIGPSGEVVARFPDALVLTSWAHDRGEHRWGWDVRIVGPATVKPTLWGVACAFVPDPSDDVAIIVDTQQAEPGTAADGGA